MSKSVFSMLPRRRAFVEDFLINIPDFLFMHVHINYDPLFIIDAKLEVTVLLAKRPEYERVRTVLNTSYNLPELLAEENIVYHRDDKPFISFLDFIPILPHINELFVQRLDILSFVLDSTQRQTLVRTTRNSISREQGFFRENLNYNPIIVPTTYLLTISEITYLLNTPIVPNQYRFRVGARLPTNPVYRHFPIEIQFIEGNRSVIPCILYNLWILEEMNEDTAIHMFTATADTFADYTDMLTIQNLLRMKEQNGIICTAFFNYFCGCNYSQFYPVKVESQPGNIRSIDYLQRGDRENPINVGALYSRPLAGYTILVGDRTISRNTRGDSFTSEIRYYSKYVNIRYSQFFELLRLFYHNYSWNCLYCPFLQHAHHITQDPIEGADLITYERDFNETFQAQAVGIKVDDIVEKERARLLERGIVDAFPTTILNLYFRRLSVNISSNNLLTGNLIYYNISRGWVEQMYRDRLADQEYLVRSIVRRTLRRVHEDVQAIEFRVGTMRDSIFTFLQRQQAPVEPNPEYDDSERFSTSDFSFPYVFIERGERAIYRFITTILLTEEVFLMNEIDRLSMKVIELNTFIGICKSLDIFDGFKKLFLYPYNDISYHDNFLYVYLKFYSVHDILYVDKGIQVTPYFREYTYDFKSLYTVEFTLPTYYMNMFTIRPYLGFLSFAEFNTNSELLVEELYNYESFFLYLASRVSYPIYRLNEDDEINTNSIWFNSEERLRNAVYNEEGILTTYRGDRLHRLNFTLMINYINQQRAINPLKNSCTFNNELISLYNSVNPIVERSRHVWMKTLYSQEFFSFICCCHYIIYTKERGNDILQLLVKNTSRRFTAFKF